MQYHELRVFVPAEGGKVPPYVLGGADVIRIVHDAIALAIAERLEDETAPVVVMWERMVGAAASGAL